MQIRPARPTDQAAIRQMIRAARLAPFNLQWPAFLVAVREGRVIGVGQVKAHRDGSRELASLAVAPGDQGQGVGSALVQALLERETGPVYLFCRAELEGFYARFGFGRAGRADLPAVIGRLLALANFGMRVLAWFSRRPGQIIAMKRAAGGAGPAGC